MHFINFKEEWHYTGETHYSLYKCGQKGIEQQKISNSELWQQLENHRDHLNDQTQFPKVNEKSKKDELIDALIKLRSHVFKENSELKDLYLNSTSEQARSQELDQLFFSFDGCHSLTSNLSTQKLALL